jgi:hypothetical protein
VYLRLTATAHHLSGLYAGLATIPVAAFAAVNEARATPDAAGLTD